MEKDLRLRLVVRRHGVPDVKLLWNVTTNEDLTISKLVAQVHEVVPLESGEWGLEDYAVELKDPSGEAFECVHYHLVSKVLKSDDQVLIRPLLTDDLKRRRLSGRHQISSDGKHLVDGLAYGRSWLKAPRDRPAVTLPPRKKARIAYSSEDELDSPSEDDKDPELPMIEFGSTRAQQDPSSVRLRARFYDAEPDADEEEEEEEEEEDDEFESGADEDEEDDLDMEDHDLQDELRLLKEDNAAVREGDLLEELRNIRGKRASDGTRDQYSPSPYSDSPVASASNALVRSASKGPSRAHLDMDSLDKISSLRAAFPSATISIVERSLLRYGKDLEKAYHKLRKSFKPHLPLHQILERQERSLSSSPIRQSQGSEGRELVLRDTSPSEHALNSPADHSEEVSDDELEESIEASETLNHNAPTAPRDAEDDDGTSGSDSDISAESSAVSSDSESDEEMEDQDENAKDQSDDEPEAYSSDGSNNSGGGQAAPEDGNSDGADRDESSSEAESSSEDSDSDASSIAETRKRSSAKSAAAAKSSPKSSSDSSPEKGSDDSPSDSSSESSSEESSSDDSSSESEPEEIPTKTLSNRHKPLEQTRSSSPPKATPAVAPAAQTAPVPPGQGLSKTQKRNLRRKLAKQAAAQATSTPAESSREQQTANQDNDDLAALLARKKALLEAIVSDAPEESQSQEQSLEIPDSAPQGSAQEPVTDASQSPSTAEQRRMKPNVGAARRMLMGSLGLKNPKTRADEDKIRQDLMKGVRPHTNARLTEAPQTDQSDLTQESVEEDPEAWREKITYRAVECCHEGVELSEPPFPFVQRWDPQQQVQEWFGSKNQRGGKRKRVQRNQAHFYEDGDTQSSKKRRLTGGESVVTFSDAVEEGDTTLNYDDPVEEPEEPHVPKVQAEGSQATDNDDLPSLPEDLNVLPRLQPGEAKIGMVVTWKQWTLSTATNWQPEIHDVTGVLVRVFDEEATNFEFILARRDRNLDKSQKVYDEDTGERIYDRFEAPDDEDEDDDDLDEGYRKLAFADLIDPRIVQHPLGEKENPPPDEESSAPTDSIIHETVYDGQSQPSQANGGNSSQSVADKRSQSQLDAESEDVSEHDAQATTTAANEATTSNAGSEADASTEEHAEEDDIATPKASAYTNADQPVETMEDSQQSGASQAVTAVSISTDRRDEISMMIREAGFRQDLSPSVFQRKTSSPSRQLLEQMSEVANTSRVHSKTPLSEMSVTKETTPIPPQSDAAAPPSSVSSVRSGRQPDLDFSFDMGGDDMPLMGETGDGSPILGASTPKASAQVQTPVRDKKSSDEPSTGGTSFPSLEHIFLTATSQPNTQNTESPSKSQVFADIKSRKSIVRNDAEYESAMRRLDEEDEEEDEDDEEDESPQAFRSTRKQLFPNSSQPAMSRSPELPDMKPIPKTAPSSFTEAQDIKPILRTRKRKSSPFVLPAGSQVIALSSSRSNSPEELQEDYAEDDIDDDYQENSSSLPHGEGWVQKNKPPRINARAKSMPAARTTAKAGVERSSMPSSTQPARSGAKSRLQRKSMSRF